MDYSVQYVIIPDTGLRVSWWSNQDSRSAFITAYRPSVHRDCPSLGIVTSKPFIYRLTVDAPGRDRSLGLTCHYDPSRTGRPARGAVGYLDRLMLQRDPTTVMPLFRYLARRHTDVDVRAVFRQFTTAALVGAALLAFNL